MIIDIYSLGDVILCMYRALGHSVFTRLPHCAVVKPICSAKGYTFKKKTMRHPWSLARFDELLSSTVLPLRSSHRGIGRLLLTVILDDVVETTNC
jgi:hypothetical protein